jgi:hypothetical protein
MKDSSGNGASLIICDTEDETSVNVLCQWEALASLRYAYLVSCFFDTEDFMKLNIEVIWNLRKGTGLL